MSPTVWPLPPSQPHSPPHPRPGLKVLCHHQLMGVRPPLASVSDAQEHSALSPVPPVARGAGSPHTSLFGRAAAAAVRSWGRFPRWRLDRGRHSSFVWGP